MKKVRRHLKAKSIFNPYAGCLCNVNENIGGESTLSRAKRSGEAIQILDHNGIIGASCTHLQGCARYAVKYPVKYDPATVATEILRAMGLHPYLPALNQYWDE